MGAGLSASFLKAAIDCDPNMREFDAEGHFDVEHVAVKESEESHQRPDFARDQETARVFCIRDAMHSRAAAGGNDGLF